MQCTICGTTKNHRGQPFRSKQGVVGHMQFVHADVQTEERAQHTAEQPEPAALSTAIQRNQLEAVMRSVLSEQLVALEEQVTAALQDAKTAVQAVQEQLSSMQTKPQHPIGLCESRACATCQAQAKQIRDAAYTRGLSEGKLAMRQAIDDALLAGGGEHVRDQIARVVALGNQRIAEDKPLIIVP